MARIGEEVVRLKAERPLVVSTPGRLRLAEDVARRIGARCVGVLSEAVSQVPIELAVAGRAKASALGADCLVSVGGGASIGLAKGISYELGLPIIALPTTYSGSEMTGFCGITIDGVKRMHTSLKMLSTTVIYDPELTLSLPVGVSTSSAMNALAHCLDAVYVSTASPIIAEAAIMGAQAVASGVRKVSRAPSDINARSELLYGAYLSGAALTGGFALQHGLAHTLGGSFGIEHSLSHAVVLPHVAAYNKQFAERPMARLAAAMDVQDVGVAFFDLLAELGLPLSLTEMGLDQSSVDDIVRITVETDNGLNPGPVTVAAIKEITEAALQGRRPTGSAERPPVAQQLS